MPESPRDPNRLLASLAQRGLELELGTVDLCFVLALHLRAEQTALASFDEDQLIDVFEQVSDAIAAGGDGGRKRATHAIRRLREQRMLARIDGAGVVRAGEYALTRLATGIVEFFLEEEALTRESLTLLTGSLLSSLAGVLEAAKHAHTEAEWRSGVSGPLRVTVSDLVAGIERRQRGFDLQQEEYQQTLAELLAADWFGAVDRCQALLDATSATLRELNQILLRDTHELQAMLEDVQELAVAAGVEEVEAAARSVCEQVDRIAAWGAARQRAWSEYYQYVHWFLRDVVRLDPARTLTQRLREQLAGRSGRSFALSIAAAPSIRLLRPVEPPIERPPVRRPRKEREPDLTLSPAEDPQAELDRRVQGALASGASGLAAITAEVAATLPDGERFVATGRIAQAVARLARPCCEPERPWLTVGDDLVIEEWRVATSRSGR